MLLAESPMCFQRTLAKVLGLEKAIVLQQLTYLLNDPKNGKVHEGHRWIYNSYKEWRDDFFPFLSERTIERIFVELEQGSLIVSAQLEGKFSRKKSYRLNEGGILHLTSERIQEAEKDHAAKLAAYHPAKLAASRTKKTNNKEDYDREPIPQKVIGVSIPSPSATELHPKRGRKEPMEIEITASKTYSDKQLLTMSSPPRDVSGAVRWHALRGNNFDE